MRFIRVEELLAHFGGSLVGKDMSGFDLSGMDFRGMDLTKANFSDAILTDTNLSWADLSGAIFSGADLTGTDLSGIILNNTIGNGKEIRTLKTNDYIVNVCEDRIQIGCKNYSISEWESFTNEEIQKAFPGALEFWNKYKNLILENHRICKNINNYKPNKLQEFELKDPFTRCSIKILL